MQSKRITEKEQKAELTLDQKVTETLSHYLIKDLAEIVVGYADFKKFQDFENSLSPSELALLQLRIKLLDNKKTKKYDWKQVAYGLSVLEKATSENLEAFVKKCIKAYEDEHKQDRYKHRTSKNTKLLLGGLSSIAKNLDLLLLERYIYCTPEEAKQSNHRSMIALLEAYLQDSANSESKLYNIMVEQLSQSFVDLPLPTQSKELSTVTEEEKLGLLSAIERKKSFHYQPWSGEFARIQRQTDWWDGNEAGKSVIDIVTGLEKILDDGLVKIVPNAFSNSLLRDNSNSRVETVSGHFSIERQNRLMDNLKILVQSKKTNLKERALVNKYIRETILLIEKRLNKIEQLRMYAVQASIANEQKQILDDKGIEYKKNSISEQKPPVFFKPAGSMISSDSMQSLIPRNEAHVEYVQNSTQKEEKGARFSK